MATTRELTYRLWRLLDGGDISDDTRFTYRELRGYIISGIAFGLKQNAFEIYNADDYRYGSDAYAKTTDIEIKVDTEGNVYADLESKSLPFGGMRNYSISSPNPFSRWAKTFVPIRSEEAFLQKFQRNIPNVIQFTIKDDKLFFINGLVDEGETLKLTVRFNIPNADSDNDDSEIGLPAEYENQIIDQCFQIVMRERIQEDRANDGVPNIN